jgi:ABC-type transport system involved in multi-copper enzyme maturation permease subunit
MIESLLQAVAAGIVFCLVQFVAALPWLAFLDFTAFKALLRRPRSYAAALGGVVGVGVFVGLVFGLLVRDRDVIATWGRVYGSVLFAQLMADVVVVLFGLLFLTWPKGASVAQAAFREGVRQPMFWFITVFAVVVLLALPIIPYFTFGEDLKMVTELGFSTIMVCAGGFGVLAAAMSISEEIEGRTAITLMSKPVSRRQFLLGKFAGLLLASLAMTAALTWVFEWVLVFKPYIDKEPLPPPPFLDMLTQSWSSLGPVAAYLLRGAVWWLSEAGGTLPGITLGFCQAMVLIAIAVALATRLPMVVNVVTCVVVYFLGHLTPLLAQVSQNRLPLVQFVAQLFGNLLPGLDYFDLGPAIVRDASLPPGAFAIYLGTVALYAALYTAISLLFGLILFEDRDLA